MHIKDLVWVLVCLIGITSCRCDCGSGKWCKPNECNKCPEGWYGTECEIADVPFDHLLLDSIIIRRFPDKKVDGTVWDGDSTQPDVYVDLYKPRSHYGDKDTLILKTDVVDNATVPVYFVFSHPISIDRKMVGSPIKLQIIDYDFSLLGDDIMCSTEIRLYPDLLENYPVKATISFQGCTVELYPRYP